jgi:adenylate cyclase
MRQMADRPKTDFEAEGLLDDLEGEQREARRALLEELAGDGVPFEELRAAAAAGRLALLPVERALAGQGPRHTAREVAEASGVELADLARLRTALGVSIPDPDDRALTQADIDAARRLKAFQEVGLPPGEFLKVARTIGMAMARIAEANRSLVVRTVLRPGDTERDLALRLADTARQLMPLVGPSLGYALQLHLLDQIRRDVIAAADLVSGEIGGATETAVCFADMVGFTKLGEQIGIEELALIAGRLEEIATTVSEPPVRLVKMIGDAAMMVSTDPLALVETALTLVETADEEGEDFPQVRAGIAFGPALAQAGDYYGRPVNLASRITGVARPGSVLADQGATEAIGDAFHHSFAGERRLKGIEGRVRLFRLRREPKEKRR